MSETKPQAELPTHRVIYTGERELKGGKLASCLIPETATKEGRGGMDGGSLFTFKRGQSQPKIVGGIYEVQGRIDADGTLGTIRGAFKFTGKRFPDEDAIVQWEAMSGAVEAAIRARKDEAKVASETSFKAALAPIKAAMRKTDHLGRVAIKTLVLAELDKW